MVNDNGKYCLHRKEKKMYSRGVEPIYESLLSPGTILVPKPLHQSPRSYRINYMVIQLDQ